MAGLLRVNAFCVGATDFSMVCTFHAANPGSGILDNAMRAGDVARLMVDLLRDWPEGRTGENIDVAVGHPIQLPSRQPAAVSEGV